MSGWDLERLNTRTGTQDVSFETFFARSSTTHTQFTHENVVKSKITREELRSPTDRWACSEFVFRAAGPTSAGINTPNGLVAGMYRNVPIDDVPNLDAVGTPGNRWSMPLDFFEDVTMSHFGKLNPAPTPWISTTPSLRKALMFLVEYAAQDGTLFVIRIRDCPDIYDAPVVTEALPRIKHELRPKWEELLEFEGWTDEYVAFGKIPSRAIAATIPAQRLLNCAAIYKVWPPMLSCFRGAGNLPPVVQAARGTLAIIDRGNPPDLTTRIIQDAVDVVSNFEGANEETFFWVVRVLLADDFGNPYEERRDRERVEDAVLQCLVRRAGLDGIS